MPKSTTKAGGWAVFDAQRGILINTVSGTRRAALVNWLVTEKHELVRATTTDEQIETLWWGLKGENDICTIVNVTLIRAIKDL